LLLIPKKKISGSSDIPKRQDHFGQNYYPCFSGMPKAEPLWAVHGDQKRTLKKLSIRVSI
jgi:hypothetical protein